MQYGHFDDEAREYVITRPDTPRPWSNYIGSAQFGGVITNNAAGYAFYQSAAQGRLTRFQFNVPPAQLCGRYVYLRDRESADFWSNSWMPVGKPLETFEANCRHGTGYTVIQSAYAGIETETTYFSPVGETYEVWSVTVRNTGDRPREISVFPFLEPQCNWNALDDAMNLQYTQYIARGSCHHGILDIGSNVNMPEDPEQFTNKDQKRHTFFGLAGAKATSFDTDLASFLGPYGSYAAPLAVVTGRCGDSQAYGDMVCAAYQVDLTLEPGASRNFALVFGVGPASVDGARAVTAMATSQARNEALETVKAYWNERLGTLRAETPDPRFNSMVNLWSPFNNLMTFYWARTASLVYAGERDGLGYRDAVQDIVGSSSLVPEESRARLELLLTGQFASGGAKPVVQPFKHDPGHETEPDHYRSDDCLWLFNAVPAFVRETGEIDFYRKWLPFADRSGATVLGHLRRAIEFNLDRTGAHGLPCGLQADWNDCLKLGEKGESVFVALQLRFALREYQQIATRLGEETEADWAAENLATLDHNIEQHAWDGDWYLRAYRDDGLKFGSRECAEGMIFMNPQSWAVISGHATGERARAVLDALHEHLATDHGVMLCTPPYVTTDPEVCLGRLMNPGSKENGGIFNHTQGWSVIALALLGMGDRAYEYLSNILPASFNERAEVRGVEPYAVCQSTHSRFSERFGAGRVSWLSGSAVWNYVAMTTAILGIQADEEGLRINPCIPSDWPEFSVTRHFRGATYQIRIANPDHHNGGINCLNVNGKTVEGNLIPPAPTGATVAVEATLQGRHSPASESTSRKIMA